MRSAIIWLLGLSLAGWACEAEEGEDVGSEGGEGGEGGSSGDGDGDGDGDGSESGSGGGGGGSGGDGDGDGETGVDACAPDAMDGPCVACVKKSCCAAFEQCEQDAGCACLFACLEADGQYLLCLTECELDLSPPDFEAIDDCRQGACEQGCMS